MTRRIPVRSPFAIVFSSADFFLSKCISCKNYTQRVFSVSPLHEREICQTQLSAASQKGVSTVYRIRLSLPAWTKKLLRLPPSWRSEKVDVKFGQRMGRESDP